MRPGEASDHAIILDSFWERYHLSPYAHGAPGAVLRALMKPLLASWKVTVACHPDIPDEVLGYVVWRDPRCVAWLHVKGKYRRRGVAKAILGHIGCVPCEISSPFVAACPIDQGAPQFTKLAESKGYIVRFRPMIAVSEMLRESLTQV